VVGGAVCRRVPGGPTEGAAGSICPLETSQLSGLTRLPAKARRLPLLERSPKVRIGFFFLFFSFLFFFFPTRPLCHLCYTPSVNARRLPLREEAQRCVYGFLVKGSNQLANHICALALYGQCTSTCVIQVLSANRANAYDRQRALSSMAFPVCSSPFVLTYDSRRCQGGWPQHRAAPGDVL